MHSSGKTLLVCSLMTLKPQEKRLCNEGVMKCRYIRDAGEELQTTEATNKLGNLHKEGIFKTYFPLGLRHRQKLTFKMYVWLREREAERKEERERKGKEKE